MDFHPELLKPIQEADVITIFGHAMPDGDCYGCQIGLRELLRETYPEKKVYAVGSGFPRLFSLIAEMDEVDEETIASSLAILVDVSCLRRVEDPRVYKAKTWIKIDHHVLNPEAEPFPWDAWVDEKRIAAAEMIADFAFENNMKFNVVAAKALYLGMATDSGRFQFYGTTEHTLEVTKRLKDMGVEPEPLFVAAYADDEVTKAYKDWMRSQAKLDGKVTYLVVHREDYESRGLPYEKASEFVNAIANVHGAPMYAYFCEDEHGNYRVELRSNRRFPVHPVARMFGGGGHRYASGAELTPEGPTYVDVLNALNAMEEDQ